MAERHATVTIPPDGLKPEHTLQQKSLEALAKRIDRNETTMIAARDALPSHLHGRLEREVEWLSFGRKNGLARPFWWWQRAGGKAINKWKRDHATVTKHTTGAETVVMTDPVTGSMESRYYVVIDLPGLSEGAAAGDDDDDDDDWGFEEWDSDDTDDEPDIVENFGSPIDNDPDGGGGPNADADGRDAAPD